MTEGHALQAIQSVLSGQKAYCKFLSGNDTGLTGAHKAGIYISKPSIPILFDDPGVKGSNKEKWVKIKWQNDLETDTRFIYYGQGTRNEYRITNFGRGFPFLRPEYNGALFVLVQNSEEDYQERLNECLGENPGWMKSLYGTWINTIENEQFKQMLEEEK